MGLNLAGYEILESAPGSGIWYNNTVCQDNLPAPTTPDVEFLHVMKMMLYKGL